MIKGITWIRPARSAEEFDALESFFSVLGFEPGKGWDDEINRGRPFLAPLGNLEFVHGTIRATADTLIEVTALDDVRRVVEHWLTKHLTASEVTKRITATEDTHWKSRAFTVEPVQGIKFAFWEWLDPLKGKPAALDGDLVANGMKFAIIVARWNAVITERLLQGALDCLHRSGVRKGDIELLRVPGSWEIPAAARAIAETKRVDGIVTLGCLLRGETDHFEAIYNEVARGIGQSQQETGVPHSFGVLTCDTLEQALDRAGLKAGNKGFEAAAAAIEMVSLKRKISSDESAGQEASQ